MKKFLLALVLLPFLSFGGFDPDFVEYVDNPTNILIFKAYIYNSNFSSLSLYSWQGNRDTLSSTVITMARIGIEVIANSNHPLRHPSGDNEVFPSSPSIDYPISRYYDNSRWYCLDYCQDINQAIQICANLIRSGYRSQVLEMFSDHLYGRVICNFNIGEVFHDVLTGTNTNFRSQLLSQLSNVNGSLQSLALSLGTVSSDYKTVNNLYLNPSKDILLNSAANSVTLNGDSGGSQNLTRLYSDSYAGRESEITKALSDLARSQLQSVWLSTLDPESPFFGNNINDILNDPLKFQQAASHGGGGSSLANIMRDVKRLSTNDWSAGVTNQLANNTASITNQLAHMFDEGTTIGSALANLQDRSLQTAENTCSIDSRLANGITVAVVNQGGTSVGVHLDGPIIIDQQQFNSLGVPLSSLQNTISDWYSDWYSFFSVSSPVYKWENFYNMVSSFNDQNHIDLVAVTNSFSSLSSLSNLLAKIDEHLTNSLPNLTNFAIVSSSFSALLLDHYEDYISNSVYSSSISKLESDYPSVYSNLLEFGLSPSGDGDFWTLFGSSLIQLDILADNFISDMALVRKFADDHIEGGFFAGINSIVEMFPSSSQLGDDLDNATNRLYEISLASTNLVLNFESVTNIAPSVFKPFADSFDSPPSGDIVFFKTANNHYVSIPVHEQSSVWSLLRMGIAFALIAVQFILFPKFVLMIVVLFDRLSSRFIKFVPTDR